MNIKTDMVEIRSLETGAVYMVNLSNVIYYEIGVYDRHEDGRESYYAEFFFENNRRLKLIRDFNFGGTKNDFKNAIRFNAGEILITKEI